MGVILAGGLRLDYWSACSPFICCLVCSQALAVTTRNLPIPAPRALLIWVHLCIYQVHFTITIARKVFLIWIHFKWEGRSFSSVATKCSGVAREAGLLVTISA